MELVKLNISGVRAEILSAVPIPANAVGAKITFRYGPEWDGLTKTVVLMGAATACIVGAGETVTIPREVLTEPGRRLLVGIYGVDAENVVIIPTLWADLGLIRSSAYVQAEEAAEPALPVWAQLQGMIGDLQELNTKDKSTLVGAVNETWEKAGASDPEQIQILVEQYLQERLPQTGGISDRAAELLIGILRSAVYTADLSESIASLQDALAGGSEEPVKTMTGITAGYTGGSVTVGTALTDLTGIVVTALYSDGSTETVTDYSLSGTIAEGGNTITVSYNGFAASFAVVGIAEAGEGGTVYSVTNNLDKALSSNSAVSVSEGDSYTATLTAATGYKLNTVTVTMGGVDVTASVYADAVITIAQVTGDIVITATVVSSSSLVAMWDFTQSASPQRDTIGGVLAEVTAGTIEEGVGLTFQDGGGMVLPDMFVPGTKIVIQFGDYAALNNADIYGQCYALLLGSQNKGLVWRNSTDGWGVYCGGWSTFFAGDKSIYYLSGKRLTVEVNSSGQATLVTDAGTFAQHNTGSFDISGNIWIGQPNGNDAKGIIVENIRIYRV